ncbi:MAG: cobyrinate a,c-diamide synthase, partial [Candidatus Kapaibacteriota bacterium]
YIDAMWLSQASSKAARNLDTFIMPKPTIIESFINNTRSSGIAIVEGNRGLYDGFDEFGSHSTAELAKVLDAPIILVLNTQKMTRTSSVIVWGLKYFDISLNIAGVIINNYSGRRHKEIIANSIVELTGVPIVGAIPRLSDKTLFPNRHLGLVTPFELKERTEAIENARGMVQDYIDIQKILDIASSASDIYTANYPGETIKSSKQVRIAYFWDRAFCFYYKENLEALEQYGAELIPVSPINDTMLPDVDGVYIGGGFPETNAEELAKNRSFIDDFRQKVLNGLPVFAECGGLMYLAEELVYNDNYKLAGILPITVSMSSKPIGHGYFEGVVDIENPYFAIGTLIRGHEFHYSYVSEIRGKIQTTVKVQRGTGSINNRDGIMRGNVYASYFHLHQLGSPFWAKEFLDFCKKNKSLYRNAIERTK